MSRSFVPAPSDHSFCVSGIIFIPEVIRVPWYIWKQAQRYRSKVFAKDFKWHPINNTICRKLIWKKYVTLFYTARKPKSLWVWCFIVTIFNITNSSYHSCATILYDNFFNVAHLGHYVLAALLSKVYIFLCYFDFVLFIFIFLVLSLIKNQVLCQVFIAPVSKSMLSTQWLRNTVQKDQKRSSRGVLKTCSKFTGEHPCRSVLCNFIEITLGNGCSPVNLLHIFRTTFLKKTYGWLLLKDVSNF